ncbi:uncharacterized protein LOC127159155 [Labeo rohita]|uniref:uncharacterized protein LOC127159155 n=1 Tax=Labeo rohita TaxID=84645 RepID=UPI0021E2BD2E|nr:uncharacterized protein LOC127159155 [Labeo rohita]XP_050958015.1 uncharacterized protein LOC127159155 [Labeo rohita]
MLTQNKTKARIQLANDTVLFLKDASQVAVALDTIKPFSKASGLCLNINKCELLPIGNCLESSVSNIPVRESVTYLGVKIIKDNKIRCSSNFFPIIEKTRKVSNHWLQRDLTLKGRVLLSKAEGISLLSYAAQSISVDKHTCKLIDGMLTKFLWKNKINYIKKPVTLKEFRVLTRAIPAGVHMLFKSSVWTTALYVDPPRPEHTSVGSICFSGLKPNNYKIRSLFLNKSISLPAVIFYWNSIFNNVNWSHIWSLPQKVLLSNKAKEISYKLIHRVYPTKEFLQKCKIDTDLKCTFCECSSETISHQFWSCQYIQHFWNNDGNILKTFSLSYRHDILGYFIKDRSLKDVCFVINFILFLCKFHIHKCKFTKCKPLFLVLEKEIKMYIDVMAKSKNSKAVKMINICSSLNIFT